MDRISIHRSAVNVTANGNNVVIPAQQGQAIKVLSAMLMGYGDVNATFTNGAGGTNLSGPLPLGIKGNGFVLPPAPCGQHWLETSPTTPLVLHLSAAVRVAGVIVYYVE